MGRPLKEQWQEFQRREPGERFQESHRQAKEKKNQTARAWRLVRILGALVMAVLGVFFSLVPGIPGFVFVFVAATMLAAESLRFARMLDAGEVKLRGMFDRLKRRRSAGPSRSGRREPRARGVARRHL